MNEFIREGFCALTHKRYKAEKAIFKSMYRDTLPRDVCTIVLEYSRIDDMILNPGYFDGREFKHCGLIGKDITVRWDDKIYDGTGPNISMYVKRDDTSPLSLSSDVFIPPYVIGCDHPFISMFKFILGDDDLMPGFRVYSGESEFSQMSDTDRRKINSQCVAFTHQLLTWQSPRS